MKKFFTQTLLAAVFTVFAGAAGAVPIISGNGLGVLTVGANADHPSTGNAVTITPHGLWQPNNPLGNGAAWVSYANTGIGAGALTEGNHLTGDPDADWIFSISETFTGTSVDFKIWADDTAQVFFNDVLVKDRNTSQNICANGTIGCQPNEFFHLVMAGLDMGPHTIRMDVYQIGGGPHGLLYSGTYAVPLPAALPLFAGGLALLGLVGWRKRQTAVTC